MVRLVGDEITRLLAAHAHKKCSAIASKPRRQPRTRSKSSGVASDAIRIITSSASGWILNPLAVNTERAEHALGPVDPVPFAAVTRLREDVGEFGSRPRLGIAALVDIVDPRARQHLPDICDAAAADHLRRRGGGSSR